MGGFSELIKNFDKTRDYVRDFFIYGFKVRNDFDRKSSRTYDDEKRRVESWLKNYLRYDNSVRGKQVAISVDSGQVTENPLYKAYYSKSFTDNDIKLHFMITDILSDGECLSLKEIVDRLDERFGEIFEEQTVRNKLKEYAAEGILITEKRGKTAYFRLSSVIITDLAADISGLSDMLKFFSETQEFGFIGNTMMKACDLKNDLFLMKHNYIVHTLEDVILTDILRAMEEKRSAALEIFSARSGFASTSTVVPLQILSSVQTGRRYLMAYTPAFERLSAYRLDNIKRVKAGGVYESYDEVYNNYIQNKDRSFSVSFGTDRGAEPLKITFHIDEERESFIIDRLTREKRCGILERTDENTYVLTLDIFDPNEAMQWIKSFTGRIKSIDGGTAEVIARFTEDMARMKEMYGGEENEHIQ